MGLRSIPLGDIERHFWMTRSIARMIGVNLSEAMADGRLSPEDYSEMVTRCRASGCTGACAAWLAEQNGYAEAAPDFCVNAERLNALRPCAGARGASDRSGAPAPNRM